MLVRPSKRPGRKPPSLCTSANTLVTIMIVAGITGAIVGRVTESMSMGFLIAFVIASFLVVSSIRIITQGYEAIVERLGRYHRKLTPGINFVIPILDRIVWMDTAREKVLELPKQQAITTDGISVDIDAIVYWRTLEIQQGYYTVEDVEDALKSIMMPTLRSQIGRIPLQEIYSSRQEINRNVLIQLDEATATWGVKVTRFELQNIIIPERVREDLENIFISKDTINIPFPDGMDWQAAKFAFEKVIVENDGIEFHVQGIETREDGTTVIRVRIPPEFDRDRIVSDVVRAYELAIRAIETKYSDSRQQLESVRQQNSNLNNVIGQLASSQPHQINLTLNPATVDVKAFAEGKSVTQSSDQSDSSRKIEIGNIAGNFSASGSALNLGDISGTVTNAINQISSSAEGDRLKEYLTELMQAIEAETAIPDDEKADAADAVQEIAAAATEKNPEQKKSAIAKATRTLNRMAKALPDATKFVGAVTKLVPLITDLFGL